MYIFVFLSFALSLFGLEVPHPWVVYYGDAAQAEELAPFNPIVLQPHSALVRAFGKRKTVLGYFNLGEIDQSDPFFSKTQEEGLLIEDNQEWRGSWKVDIRNPFWKRYVLKTAIPVLLSQGFTGIFLDQVDVSIDLETRNPTQFSGMKKAAIDLIRDIRKYFPKIKLMLNRGYEILPQIGRWIDYELAETLYTFYDVNTQTYQVRSKEEYDWQLQQLQAAHKQFPRLVLFSLDYWDPTDRTMIDKIYEIELQHFLRPYVATIHLDKIVLPP
ncbi:MAG: endo alpha-1,4 polygalactosaminidase [Verrucomicrobia bacterium]|nr:endo alpha-1,4 polygalactosaminidase [Verrucomicrobiota bacterium]MBU6446509.1 endo alpha-1,4 polygalactosaminidase [Verrucomicrobiota bacterium]MDE3046842.1 endo alpha-1,4 polygalactosaminidase [Verrucomicrobiota bacterium]